MGVVFSKRLGMTDGVESRIPNMVLYNPLLGRVHTEDWEGGTAWWQEQIHTLTRNRLAERLASQLVFLCSPAGHMIRSIRRIRNHFKC